MNKLLASLLIGAFAFAMNTTVFAADATAKTDAPVTAEASSPTAGAAKTAPAKAAQKHHKHAKKMTETAK
ncbi:MAG TPA: hypothetical protein VK946_00520 [Methylotenera sp.]|nr:hypothetical protein [Methylotenera sp.]